MMLKAITASLVLALVTGCAAQTPCAVTGTPSCPAPLTCTPTGAPPPLLPPSPN